MGEQRSPDKPFVIAKRAVWEAWEKVRANRGAPGADAVSIAVFEKDLKGNLPGAVHETGLPGYPN